MEKKKKRKSQITNIQHGLTLSIYCTITVTATRRLLCFAKRTHTRLPFQRHCYVIYKHDNKNESE